MEHILWFVYFVTLTSSTIYTKLSSTGSNTLFTGDYLVSTLGYCRFTLIEQSCQIKIQSFTGTSYNSVGMYPRATTNSQCSSLSIMNSTFSSSNGIVILQIRPSLLNNSYSQTYLTIDEMCIIRMIATSKQKYIQNWITIFRTPQPFLYSTSNLIVTPFDSLSIIQNSNKWGFSASLGELRIFKVDNVSKIIRYNYKAFTITPNSLLDYNGYSIPNADINNLNFNPKCQQPSSNSFVGPYTFIIHPFWPEIRLIDHQGYQILNVRYPSINCTRDIAISSSQTSECLNWFCPSFTFDLNGDCVASCPPPYYHQIKPNSINRCVLMCQSGFNINNDSRVCSCSTYTQPNCTFPLKKYILSCGCSSGLYFHQLNRNLSNSNSICQFCLKDCGLFYYEHKDGICVPCPLNCLNCTLSNNSVNYLLCTKCEQGYAPNGDGICFSICSSFLKVSNAGSKFCIQCIDRNCKNCSLSSSICSECSLPFSLFNKTCVLSCPSEYKSIFLNDSFWCRPIIACNKINNRSNSLILVTNGNNNSNCYCKKNITSYAYSQFCGNKSICSTNNYLDTNTLECLPCPIGCVTCSLNTQNQIQCSSCSPQYILSISAKNSPFCVKYSLLYSCQQYLNLSSHICSPKNLASLLSNNSPRTLCLLSVANCNICTFGSSKQCILCQTDFLLYQGKCFKVCPNETYPYSKQSVCLQKTISNCQTEKMSSFYYIFNLNSKIRTAQGYSYLITPNYVSTDKLNDPKGSIFAYIFANSANNLSTRVVNIAAAKPRCLICQEGYGLTKKGNCEKCKGCDRCIFANSDNSLCLKPNDYYTLTSQNTCKQLKLTQLPCLANQYRNQSSICSNDCLYYYRSENKLILNNNMTINCTLNCPSQYSINSYLKENNVRLICDQTGSNPSESIKFIGNKITLSDNTIFMFISDKPLKNLTYNFAVSIKSSTQRILQSANNSFEIIQNQFGLLILVNQSVSSPILIQLQPSLIWGQNNNQKAYLGNSIYGFETTTSSLIDKIYNQTSNLYMYGRAYIVLLLILSVIFWGQHVNYKTDNTFILFSVIYLTLPSLNLTLGEGLFQVYSFLYGFAWSCHLQLLSNPRWLTNNSEWFNHPLYLQTVNNNAHYLLFVDNNLLRNVWSVLLILFVIAGIGLFLFIIMQGLSVSKLSHLSKQTRQDNFINRFLNRFNRCGYQSSDIDHLKSVGYFVLFFIENSIMGLIYYSTCQILNSKDQFSASNQSTKYKIAGIVFLLIIFVYSSVRLYMNRIGGAYCFKRLALGFQLGLMSYLGGINQNIFLTLLLLIVTEIIFVGFRIKYELIKPYFRYFIWKDNSIKPKVDQNVFNGQVEQNRQKSIIQLNKAKPEKSWDLVLILVEEFLIVLTYIFLSLINSLGQVSAIFIWMIVNTLMISFAVQFVDLIVNYWKDKHTSHQTKYNYYKIRNVWDHDYSCKSLAETNQGQ